MKQTPQRCRELQTRRKAVARGDGGFAIGFGANKKKMALNAGSLTNAESFL